jgi:UDP-glucose 4-epimerase
MYGMVLPRFVERALRDEPLLVYGTGKQSRCFAYVGDVVDCLIDLMNTPEAAGRVYNIGSTEEISIEVLADRVIEMTESNSVKEYVSYEMAYGRPFDDMMRRIPCLDRVKAAVGYEPRTGLTRTLEYVIADKRALLQSGAELS